MKEAPRRPNISEVHLKAAREAAGIKQKETLSILKQVEPRVDKPMVSKYENGVCIPTPSQLSALCALYGCPLSELYGAGILEYFRTGGQTARKAGTRAERPGTYKLTVRLPDALATGLRERLRRKGYESITAYIVDCIEQLPPEEPEA